MLSSELQCCSLTEVQLQHIKLFFKSLSPMGAEESALV